jgi:tungstate transport system substrate-binding protein
VLINHYHALLPPPTATPGAELARRFAAFIASPAGQAIVAAYGREQYGHPLYQPAAPGQGSAP